jgi:hypothetical protein
LSSSGGSESSVALMVNRTICNLHVSTYLPKHTDKTMLVVLTCVA